ncbi:MAG: hypothetical protein Q8Q65_00260 [bacterium]|nr:hypothetical protein [bacterium]
MRVAETCGNCYCGAPATHEQKMELLDWMEELASDHANDPVELSDESIKSAGEVYDTLIFCSHPRAVEREKGMNVRPAGAWCGIHWYDENLMKNVKGFTLAE